MSRIIRTAQRTILSASTTLTNGSQPRIPTAYSLLQLKPCATSTCNSHNSPFNANILRILSNEIEYQLHYAPSHQPASSFNSFTVQDRPGEMWMTMRGKHGDDEEIKIEVTMFDGCVFVPKPGEDSNGENVLLHISLLVDVSKGQGCPELEFLCSAWPDRLEIQKVYLLNRHQIISNPYMGPDFGKMNGKLQKMLHDYLEVRGVNNELCIFLHEYMMNKDRIELIQWLRKVKSIVEK